MSVNKVILLGHVGKDPEIKRLDQGISVATFSLATTEKGYTLQNGTTVPDRTEWHNIVAWRGLADVSEKYIRKGSQIYLEGKITTRSWEKDGIKIYRTEITAENIQLLGSKKDSQSEQSQYPGNSYQEPYQTEQARPAMQQPQRVAMPEPGLPKEENDLPF